MGFSFGLLIWLPLATRAAPSGGSWMANNFLSMVAANALLLLSEVCFYNTFGFDRSAAQMYFLVPVRPATVMAAKNIAAVFFVTVEVTLVAIGCAIFRMPVTPARIAEAGAVTAVLTLFLLGIGNLGSTRSPRSQDPNEGWRRSAGSKVALWSLLFYPLMSVPISLAYLARWAFAREAAFYAVIAVGLLIAGCFYWVSLDSAVETMRRDREKFLMLLTQGDSPAV
jgi:ABC-2 type transport system permease protein